MKDLQLLIINTNCLVIDKSLLFRTKNLINFNLFSKIEPKSTEII